MFVSRLRKYGSDHDHITPAAGSQSAPKEIDRQRTYEEYAQITSGVG